MNGRRCPDRVSYGCVVIGIGGFVVGLLLAKVALSLCHTHVLLLEQVNIGILPRFGGLRTGQPTLSHQAGFVVACKWC